MNIEGMVALELGDTKTAIQVAARMESMRVPGWRSLRAESLRARGWIRDAIRIANEEYRTTGDIRA